MIPTASEGTNIKRISFFLRYPLVIYPDQLLDALQEDLLFDGRDAKPLAGIYHAFIIFFRAEQVHPVLIYIIGFCPFEYGLGIMEGVQCRRYLNRTIWLDDRRLPLSISILHFQHMIGKYFTESRIVKIHLVYPAFFNFLNGNIG